MKPEQIQQLIEAGIPGAAVTVTTPDSVHFEAEVIASAFEGLSRVKQHQMVYACLKTQFADEDIHALALKTRAAAA